MTTVHSQADLGALAKRAGDDMRRFDPHLFDLSELPSPADIAEREAIREEERAYWAASDRALHTAAANGSHFISEDRGE